MQTGIDLYCNPKVKRGMWQRGRHQPYVAPDLFGVSERVGSGATLSKLSYVTEQAAIAFLFNRAVDYKTLGYVMTWHDENRWFEATCTGKPTVFCVLTEQS